MNIKNTKKKKNIAKNIT